MLKCEDPNSVPLMAPVPPEGWTREIREFFAIMEGPQCLEEGTRFNIQAVMANHPQLSSAWARYNQFVAKELELSDRLREIAILRTGWLNEAGYEWHQHRISGLRCGLTDAHIEAAKMGADAAIWTDEERLVVRAADGLCTETEIPADTVTALIETFGPRRVLELLWTIGSYLMLGRIMNSLRVPIEAFCLPDAE